MERSIRKNRKIREVVIEDFEPFDELTDKSIIVNQMTSSLGKKFKIPNPINFCALMDEKAYFVEE